MMIPVAGIGASAATLSAIARVVAALYGVASGINDFVNEHIEAMKASDNATISRTGRVLEMAKFGFGLGYLSSVTVIAVGQLLLGNTLSAVSTVLTAATLTNPIAMTCAAVGAIVYGWGALSDQERDDILNRLARGLEIGIELIKSIVNFVIAKTNEMLDSKVVRELRELVSDKAALFGRSLSDITKSTTDAIAETALTVAKTAEVAFSETFRAAEMVLTEGAKLSSGAIAQTAAAAGQLATAAIERGADLIRRPPR